MPPSASNRYSVLSEKDSDPTDLRIEMGDLKTPNSETEQAQVREVSCSAAGNSVACLIVLAFDLKVDRGAVAEQVQGSSKATEIDEARATADDLRASPTKDSELPNDEVTDLLGRVSAIVDILLTCR